MLRGHGRKIYAGRPVIVYGVAALNIFRGKDIKGIKGDAWF
jgi:hypothetical protein